MASGPSWLEIFAGAAARAGGRVEWHDEFEGAGLIRLPSGATTFFHRGVLDLNPVAAARIARDKSYTTAYLRRRGFRVPTEHCFFSDAYSRRKGLDRGLEAAVAYAKTLGFPVFVKPIRRSAGAGVAKVYDEEELGRAAALALRIDLAYLIQRFEQGLDFRIIVFDGDILWAYERSPLAVTGNGADSVADLLATRQRQFEVSGRDTRLDTNDWRLQRNLRREGLNFTSIPEAGRRVKLHDIANLSVGGDAHDVLAELPDSIAKTALAAARELNLRFCGVDIILENEAAAMPLVLEVNSAPGLDNYLYDDCTPLEFAQKLYGEILKRMNASSGSASRS